MKHFQTSTSLSGVAAHEGVRLAIEYVPLGELKTPERQVRNHTQRQLKALARSLKDFGAIIPIVISADGTIVVGVAVVAAARRNNMAELPAVRITHLDDHQLRLFRIAHTKLTDGGSWNMDAVRLEFAEISVERPQLELGSSGFCIAERDIIFGNHRVAEMADLDDQPEEVSGAPVSRVGDGWICGRHIVFCGDATDPAVIEKAVMGQRIRTVASDPPYNVEIGGNVSGLGKNKHQEFAMASGEMSRQEFVILLARALGAAQPHLEDGALLYLFMDWRHLVELSEAAEARDLKQLNLLVWAKTNAAMGSLYRSAHEMIGVFKHGEAAHINNVELGRHGRNRTNVIHMPGVNSFGKGRNKALETHPTVKPVGLLADLLLDSSGPGDRVLDPFGGSGTTLIAAEKTDRIASLVELEPKFVDATIRRFEALTGETVSHAETGLSFANMAELRQQEAR
ncbi:DNA modification methylase [Sphingomonas bacterium]|uniref:DNA modification methylase n=1 Tax=Sphingomonas bacterium TaxID=1895847 RepID=UPI0015765838|nr:DNA methyltransferase [Sphingomonas bacterium]